jgi:hypothetical protein
VVQVLAEVCQLLLQGGDLGWERAQHLEHLAQFVGQRRRLLCRCGGSRHRSLLWQSRKAAMMGMGQ